jgi:hypothetical protein
LAGVHFSGLGFQGRRGVLTPGGVRHNGLS